MIPTIRHERVGPSDSPHSIRIAHLSDLHIWFSRRTLQRIERAIATWQPDVVVLTGDFADTPMGRRLVVDWIQTLATLYPVCWVAGNHDHWWGNSFLQRLEALAGVHPIDRRDAWISGKSGHRFRFTSWERVWDRIAPSDLDSPVILLHDPGVVRPEKIPVGRKGLLLAGHLHGGQINLWRDRAGRGQPAASWYNWMVNRTTIGDATLIVSGGLGDTLPLRFRAPHEIVIVDLWAGSQPRSEAGNPAIGSIPP
jgi:uncharacterized protein